jgi:hypothetical protein
MARRKIMLAVVLTFLALATSPGAVGGQATAYVSRADLVTVRASVTTRLGFRLTDLSRDEFEVLDNGKVRPVVQFAFAARPVDVAILLHRSGGYRLATWPLPARVMLESLQAGDRMSIHTPGGEVQPLTDQLTLVAELFQRPVSPSPPSPLWPGLERVVGSLTDPDRNRALVILTDGHEIGTGPPPSSLTTLARRTDVGVYVASNGTVIVSGGSATPSARDRSLAIGADYLKNLVRTTGGREITMPGTRAPAVYRAFLDELREQYLLGFQPEAFDGTFHTLTVRVKRPDTTIIARTGYTAVKKN